MAGTVDGKPCCLAVDTGAEKTIAREDMVNTRNPLVVLQQQVTGHCISLKGPVGARISVDSKEAPGTPQPGSWEASR